MHNFQTALASTAGHADLDLHRESKASGLISITLLYITPTLLMNEGHCVKYDFAEHGSFIL